GAAPGVAGGYKAQLARGRAVQQPSLECAILDQRHAFAGNAFGVERPRAQAAAAQWVVDDVDAAGENLLAHFVLEEARLARDRGAVDGADEMPDDRSGDV